jgi:DNA-binding response OmpR family regulator
MPNLSGLEVTRALRERLITVPVILLTARARESDVREGGAAGADAYITKPFSPQELELQVRDLTHA